jgi:hypothetical protein
MSTDGTLPAKQDRVDELAHRIAALSPAKRVLFELELQKKNAVSNDDRTIPRRMNSEPLPLSFAQQRLWF